jgi:hypothetical protein
MIVYKMTLKLQEQIRTQSKNCIGCNTVYPLTKFYRIKKYTNAYQSKCIPCHNKARSGYKQTNFWKRRPKGFSKLSPELQREIQLRIEKGTQLPTISRELQHMTGCPSYHTLRNWVKKGIPKLDENPVTEVELVGK